MHHALHALDAPAPGGRPHMALDTAIYAHLGRYRFFI